MNSIIHCRVENDNKKIIRNQIFDSDMRILLIFSLISLVCMLIPYHYILKSLYQVVLIAVLIYAAIKKPSLVLPLFLVMSTGPIRIYMSVYTQQINFICFDNMIFMIAGLIAVSIIRLCIIKKIKIKQVLPVVLICLIMGLSYFYTDDNTRSLYYRESFFVMLVSYAIVPIFIDSKKDFNTLLKGFFICLIQAAIFLAISLTIANNQIDSTEAMDRNYSSFYYVLIIVSSFVFVLSNNSNKFLFLITLGCSVIVLIILFMLVSRSAFLILIAAMLIIMLVKMRKLKHFILAAVLVGGILAFIVCSGIADDLLNRFKEEEMESGNGRVDIAIKMLELFANRPFGQKMFGTGHNSAFVWWNGVFYTPHNSYIGYLMHYGLFGLFMLLFIFASSVIRALNKKDNRIYLGILIVLLMYCFVLEPHSKAEFIIMLVGFYSANLNK